MGRTLKIGPAVTAADDLKVYDLDCPECGAPMRLRRGKDGRPFYSCSTWPKTRCPGTHGAHRNGKPLGIPANQETKQARIRAHQAFDGLWKTGEMSRSAAYCWMRRAMGLTSREAHIGRFDIGQCERLIQLVSARKDEKIA